LLVAGELVVGRSLAPAPWLSWQTAAIPIGTVLVAGLALIRDMDFATLLSWAMRSTQTAIERLDSVQEHRAQLHRNMRDLDDAYHRLERTNEMLTAARAEAEEARQARNQFALTVSHELRTPLNFIIGFSELMVNAPETYAPPARWPAGLYDDIQEIYRSSKHLLQLVDDILDLGKAEAHRLVLIKEWVSPSAIIQEAEAIVQPAVAEQGLCLKTEIEPELPAVFVDRTRIRQVLINLLSNSLRYTEHGSITVSARRDEAGLLFCVRDTGPGIAPEEIAKVFEDFGQADATVWRRRDGTGLGVPISQRFVTMHGGKMWLQSQVGEGSCFYFTLPGAGTEPSWQPELDMDAYWRFMAERNRAPHLVVVLSPDPGAEGRVQACLPGYQVIATNGAGTAAKQVEHLLPQAMIVDQSIAGEADVQQLIARLPYDLPVLTFRLPGSSIGKPTLPSCVADYLVKPVLREDLLAAMSKVGAEHETVLVVDDDPAMLRFVSIVLEGGAHRAGTRVIPASSGREALRVLERLAPNAGDTALDNQVSDGTAEMAHRIPAGDQEDGQPGGTKGGQGTEAEDAPPAPAKGPALIMLDLNLPDISGWDVLRSVQTNPAWQGIPVILVTGVSLAEEIEARDRKVLQISTCRPLGDRELAGALSALLEAVPPKFQPGRGAVGQPGVLAA
jgi:signal transduction histidine kinase/CheY-like chemotaxis protein